jgi:hypothetical protein
MTYVFSTCGVPYKDAGAQCQQMGGLLTSWATPEEQADVEQYFISKVGAWVHGRCAGVYCQAGGRLHADLHADGGHLSSASLLPQGTLIPEFHKAYWFGLSKASSNAANFTWFDPYVVFQQNSGTSYSHWGTFVGPAGSEPEPNNFKAPALCAVANFTEEYDGAWGWADTRCSTNFTFICKIIRGWPAAGIYMPELPSFTRASVIK